MYYLGSTCVSVFGFSNRLVDRYQYVYRTTQTIRETNCVTGATRTTTQTSYSYYFCYVETFVPCDFPLYNFYGPFC